MSYRYPSIVPRCTTTTPCIPNKKYTNMKVLTLDFSTTPPFVTTQLGLAYNVIPANNPLDTNAGTNGFGLYPIPLGISSDGIVPSNVPRISSASNIVGASFVAPFNIPNTGGPTQISLTDSSMQFGAFAISSEFLSGAGINGINNGESVVCFWSPTGSPLWQVYTDGGEVLPSKPVGSFEVYYF
jgi:hypothetical protein